MSNKQAGGVVSFVVVGLVLAGLLGAGLYFSKSMGREARDAGENVAEVASNTKQAVEDKVNEEKKEDAAEKKDGAETGTQQNGTTSSTQTQTPSSGAGRVATTGPSDNIPSTGPTETFAAVVALCGLTFATYVYSSARRELRTSALNR